MKYYTEKQALGMVVNGVGAALNYTKEVSSDMTDETIKVVAHGSMIDPSTLDIQKQIEAVRGLIEIKNDMDTTLEGRPDVMISIWSDRITKELRTLTETLKPFLGNDELEV